MRVRDHQFDAAKAAPRELAEELGPDQLGLGSAYFHFQNFATTVRVHPHGDDDGDGHDPPAAPDLQVGGVNPQIGQSPSIGRSRKAFTFPSISSQSRDTWLLEIPDMPIALTRSSTDRVETP